MSCLYIFNGLLLVGSVEDKVLNIMWNGVVIESPDTRATTFEGVCILGGSWTWARERSQALTKGRSRRSICEIWRYVVEHR